MFIIELTYAGIFNIKDIEDEEALKEVLFIYCPSLNRLLCGRFFLMRK